MGDPTDSQSQPNAPTATSYGNILGNVPASERESSMSQVSHVSVQPNTHVDQTLSVAPGSTSDPGQQSSDPATKKRQSGDSVNHQIATLEQKLADMASKGINVQRASSMLDELCDKLQSPNTSQPTAINTALNSVRYEIAIVPSEQKFSSGKAQLWLALYEIILLMVAILLLFVNNTYLLRILSSQQAWSLADIWAIAAIAGLIGASTNTMYALYHHKVVGTVNPNYVAWYLLRPIVGGISAGFIGIASTIILNGISDKGIGEHLPIILLGFLSGVSERFTNRVIMDLSNKFSSGRSSQVTTRPTSTSGSNVTL